MISQDQGEDVMIKTLTRMLPLFACVVALSALTGAASPAQAAGARCNTASQCHGILPQICERCSNGHTVCAHHACVHHKCVVQICGQVTKS